MRNYTAPARLPEQQAEASDRSRDRIVVATDGSPGAEAAATLAIRLAGSLGLGIHGLYVVDRHLILDSYARYRNELGISKEVTSRAQLVDLFRERGETALRSLEQRCRASYVSVTADLIFGSVSDSILQEAAKARLLVLGRRGWGKGDLPGRVGHNFRNVVRRARCPLLIGGDMPGRIHRVLLAVSARTCSARSLEWTAMLSHTLPAEVTVLWLAQAGYADVPETEVSRVVAQLGQWRYPQLRFETHQHSTVCQVAASAEVYGTDLLILGELSENALLNWFARSALVRLAQCTTLPLLIV